MKMGDVFCMAGFTAWQPTCSASFKPPKGRVAVVLLLGDADKKNPDSFDPALVLNQIGWHREDGELIQGLMRQNEELQKAVELHAGYHAKADEVDRIQAENEALRKDAERWSFFKGLSCQIQAFPHSWGQMTPEKMDFMCDEAMAKEVKP